MLVLLRGQGDEIILTIEGMRDIHVRVLRVDGDCVRIGIDADPQVSIIRAELLNNDAHALRRHPYAPSPTLPEPNGERQAANEDRRAPRRTERWRSEKRD